MHDFNIHKLLHDDFSHLLKMHLFMCLLFFFFNFRSKDYTAPVNFVSAGLRKTAAEEKQQQKPEAGSDDDGDDGDGDDGPSAPPPPRGGGAPKKLQMVKNTFMLPDHRYTFCNSALSK